MSQADFDMECCSRFLDDFDALIVDLIIGKLLLAKLLFYIELVKFFDTILDCCYCYLIEA